MELLTYLISGAVAGLMAGLLGVGGGLIIVPALALLFVHQGFAADSIMHYAVGTSLATIIPTSISSLLAHQRRGSVHWPVVRLMVPGILLGALASAWLAKQMSSSALALLFGVFVLLVAGQLLLGDEAGTAPATAGGCRAGCDRRCHWSGVGTAGYWWRNIDGAVPVMEPGGYASRCRYGSDPWFTHCHGRDPWVCPQRTACY